MGCVVECVLVLFVIQTGTNAEFSSPRKVQNLLHLPCQRTSGCPKLVRTSYAFDTVTWKRASRHNCVQFSSFICLDGSVPAALESLLLDPPEPSNTREARLIVNYNLNFYLFFLLPFGWGSGAAHGHWLA